MKQTRLLSLVILLLCFYACGSKPYPRTMQIADTLVYSNPDSACLLLQQLQDSITTEPQKIQMYYQLLNIKAQDKAYITHTSDSLILEVLHYYKDKKDKTHLPEAYYYAGRVYSDLGDAPQALDYYQKAAELLEGSTDYRLLKVIYSQMGELFLFQDVYEEAMKAYKKSYQYQACINDKRGMIISLCNIGATFTGFGNADSAFYYYQQAYEQARKYGKKLLIRRTQFCLISLYTQLKQYDSAITTLHSLDQSQPYSQVADYAIAADLYLQIGEKDSATYYYNKLLEFDDIYAQQAAHFGLAEIAQKEFNCQSVMEHISYYNEYTDSIKKITNSGTIQQMQSLYNYQLREKKNIQLERKNAQQKFWLTIILWVLSISIFLFFIYFYSNKHKKLQLQNSLKEVKRQKEELHQRSTLFIEENKRKIEELEIAIQENTKNKNKMQALLQNQKEQILQKEKLCEKNAQLIEENTIKITELEQRIQTNNASYDSMQRLLKAQKEQILRMNCKIEADQEEQALAEIAFHQSDIYNKFRDAANGNKTIEAKDWEILRIKTDRCYKDFTARLQAIYPVTDIEMKICLLLKIKISVTGISLLTGRSKSAIVSARKKLYEKTHGETGKPEQWDAFILSL